MIPLSPEELTPGQILAKSVDNHQGVLLVEKGSRLSDKHIRVFKTWGVKQIYVQSDQTDQDASPARVDERSQTSVELELRRKFADVLDDPVMVAIMEAAGRQLTQKVRDPEDPDELT
jgi:hypothetical protein